LNCAVEAVAGFISGLVTTMKKLRQPVWRRRGNRQAATWLLRILWHKPFQRTAQSLPDPNSRCEKHVQLPRFNSLNIANVQVGNLREPLLADVLGKTFPANVVAKLFQPR